MSGELDADRQLALTYVPARLRAALEALWRLDVTLGAILATGTDPRVSQIRLAWWREALERLDHAPPPAEPVLQGLAAHVLPTVTGVELAGMEAGWAELLAQGALDQEALDRYAAARGGRLFRYSARLLGLDGEVDAAGERWALVDLARHSGGDAMAAQAEASARPALRNWPKQLRPLGMLDALARRDVARGSDSFERQGSPGRMLRMLRHRLTGH
ncbi:MAG TPA: squalene/phytoene synthase family protein [Allosphingosinicella sp.]|nr:squalene/phytoene synthase family protein [Allosphingosinicella sp.]